MIINEAVIKRLREYKIPVEDGIPFLLGVYFDQMSQYFPLDFKQRVMAAKIFEVDRKAGNTIKWNLGLFDDQITGFEWVREWMDLFGQVNPERRGTKSSVVARMKKFFAENPAVRKDTVMDATKMYIRSVENPKFLKSSHRFIMDGKGAEKYSGLLEWIEKYETWNKGMENRKTLTNTMQ